MRLSPKLLIYCTYSRKKLWSKTNNNVDRYKRKHLICFKEQAVTSYAGAFVYNLTINSLMPVLHDKQPKKCLLFGEFTGYLH